MRLTISIVAAIALATIATIAVKSSYSANYTVQEYRRDMQPVLAADKKLKAGDYSLWPKVAELTRRLALNAGTKVANQAIDQVFRSSSSKKLYSRVWAVLPFSAIEGLGAHQYRAKIDIYGAKTKHPRVRRDLLTTVAAHQDDAFIEFAYFALGQHEKAIRERPNSPIRDVLHHAVGFTILGSIVKDAYSGAISRANGKVPRPWREDVDRMLTFLNKNPEFYDRQPLAKSVPKFSERAAMAQPHFEIVKSMPAAPLADDAAYFLGWLAFHEGRHRQALNYFKQGMILGNGDYRIDGSVKQTTRIFEQSPVSQQFAILKSNPVVAKQAPLWYVAARSAYRSFDYELSSEIARAGLKSFKVSADRLPVTTDTDRIESALGRYKALRKDWNANLHIGETAYLLAAAREHQRYLASLPSIGKLATDQATERVKTVIVKYSKMLDRRTSTSRNSSNRFAAVHKDLRQSRYLIDATLNNLPKKQRFVPLREWLHYRKTRILAVFAPKSVSAAVAVMENDAPNSSLLDDALAEQVFAEGYMIGDITAAQTTFSKLISKYPNGNAVDNGYSWMAISYRCAGQTDKAQAVNREIIGRFPRTRHAVHAARRIADPAYSLGCYFRRNDEE